MTFAKSADIYDFILDRLRGYYTEKGVPTQHFNAIAELRPHSLYDFDTRLDAIGQFAALPEAEPKTQYRAQHILITGSGESAQRLALQIAQEARTGVDFGQLARQYAQDASASTGGDLGWIDEGETVPEFERAMDAHKEGELSPVVQSPFGMHLIQVSERRQRDVSAERQRGVARQALRDRKLDEAYQDWLRQLRDRTYVENRLNEQ